MPSAEEFPLVVGAHMRKKPTLSTQTHTHTQHRNTTLTHTHTYLVSHAFSKQLVWHSEHGVKLQLAVPRVVAIATLFPLPPDPLTLALLPNPLPRTFNALLEFGISNYNRNWSSCGMQRWTDYWQITVDWGRRREGGRNVGIGVWNDDNWRNKLESIFNHGDNAALLQVPEPQTKPANVLQLRVRLWLPLRVQLRLPAVT